MHTYLQQGLQPSFDKTFGDWSLVPYLADYVSVMKLFFYLSGNKALCIDLGVATFSLPDRALDTADSSFAKLFRMPYSAYLETFLSMICH